MVLAISFAAALLAILMLAYAIGCLLPHEYESEVMAYIHRSQADVFEAVMDYRRNPLTGMSAKEIVEVDSGKELPSWREKSGPGGILVETTAINAPRSLSRLLRDDRTPRRAHIEYRFQEANEGCRVVIVNRTSIPKGDWRMPMFRLMMTLDGAAKGARDYLNRLGHQLGEPVRFE